MYFVYAIKRIQRKYIYIGITDNPKRKLNQNQQGYENYKA
ncbi:MAG: GIY-YIG nuclease family protein [Bacteroidetes bacterium]|nr:GIY-YIG nuclease family protein [Bacteroidota bacterium]